MIGWALFSPRRHQDVIGTCSPQTRRPSGSGLQPLDMLSGAALQQLLRDFRPDLVLHCAAICKVEKCERHPTYAWDVNVVGTQNLLDRLATTTRLVYCSSDHVFSGESGPYHEDSPPDPLSQYGQTRVEAERRVLAERPDSLVIRVPLCVGPSYNGRSGHLDWLRHRSRQGLPMTIVSDEYRSALPLGAAAQRVQEMARSQLSGLRHLAARRVVSRPELARHLMAQQGLDGTLEFQSRAQRPVPHLGRVELLSRFSDRWAQPLPSALDPE
jgi:dTDP-4-dehydrorhamnose reductase